MKTYRVRELAEERGIMTQRQLMIAANLNNQAAQKLWKGNGTITSDSLLRVAAALKVGIGELFEEHYSKKNNEGSNNNEAKESNVVESGNKEPLCVPNFTGQHIGALKVIPAFETPPSYSQTRSPYRKAA
jgi:transcriptional regulator with XRE-family HTH domain